MAEASTRSSEGLFEWMHARVVALLRQAGHTLPEPVAAAELDVAAQRIGVAVPASYCRVLSLQDGWPEAWRGLSLVNAAELSLEADLLIVGRADDGRVLAFEVGEPMTDDPAEIGEPPVLLLDTRGREVERWPSFNEWLRGVAEEGVAE